MINLALHVKTGSLVAWQGCIPVIPAFRQGKIPVRVRIVDDNPLYPNYTSQQYSAADLSAYSGIRLGLWTKAAFSNGTGELCNLAIAHSVADQSPNLSLNQTDTDDPYYEGNWDLATTEIADLGAAKKALVYFTVALARADGSLNPLIDQAGAPNGVLYAAADDGFIATPGTGSTGYAVLNLPCSFRDVDSGRVWELNVAAGTDNLTFVRIV